MKDRDEHPRELISAFLDGEIDPRGRAAVETHLSECATCRALVDDLRVLDAAIGREEPPAVPPALVSRIGWRVRAETARRAPRARAFFMRPPWILTSVGTLAAAVLLVFVLVREQGRSAARLPIIGTPERSEGKLEPRSRQGAGGEGARSNPDQRTDRGAGFATPLGGGSLPEASLGDARGPGAAPATEGAEGSRPSPQKETDKLRALGYSGGPTGQIGGRPGREGREGRDKKKDLDRESAARKALGGAAGEGAAGGGATGGGALGSPAARNERRATTEVATGSRKDSVPAPATGSPSPASSFSPAPARLSVAQGVTSTEKESPHTSAKPTATPLPAHDAAASRKAGEKAAFAPAPGPPPASEADRGGSAQAAAPTPPQSKPISHVDEVSKKSLQAPVPSPSPSPSRPSSLTPAPSSAQRETTPSNAPASAASRDQSGRSEISSTTAPAGSPAPPTAGPAAPPTAGPAAPSTAGPAAPPVAGSAPMSSKQTTSAPRLDDLLALTRKLSGCASLGLVSRSIVVLPGRAEGDAARSLRDLAARSGGHFDSADPRSGVFALWTVSSRWAELAAALRSRGGPFEGLPSAPPEESSCAVLFLRLSPAVAP